MPISTGTAVPNVGQPVRSQSSHYFFLSPTASTSATLGNGTLRAAPIYVPKRVTLDRIGAEVTSLGDVGSKVRLGIYNDNGNLYPGALLLDAGTIAGDAIAVAEITISQVLDPGVYWLVGAVQLVTVLQPTVRTAAELPLCPSAPDSTLMTTDLFGFSKAGVTGALPTPWGATVTQSGSMPRIFVRAA